MISGVRWGIRISAIALFVAVCVVQPAGAVSSGGIGGRPANPDPSNPRTQSIFIMTVDRGQSKQDAVDVINNSDITQKIKLYAVDGVVTNTGAYTCRQDAEARVGLGAWTHLDQSEVTLAPGKDIKVPFTVKMPSNADVGEHDGCIVFASADDTVNNSAGNVQLHTRQAIRLVATVPGDLKRDITIQSFDFEHTDGKSLYSVALKNVGNVSADVDIKVSVRSLFGNLLYSNGGGYPVISNQVLQQQFEQTNKPFFGGWYVAQASIQYDMHAGEFGTSNTSSLITKKSHAVTVFMSPQPLAALLMLVVVLAIIGGLVYWLVSRRNQQTMFRTARVHTVLGGETIQSIANDYGVPWNKLTALNHLKPPYILEPGAELRVPSSGPQQQQPPVA